MLREGDIFRHHALRKHLETKLDRDRSLFAARIQMEVEIDLRSRFYKPPGVWRKDVAVFAQSVFVKKQPNGIVFRILNEICREMMNNFETAIVGGLAFDGHHVHIFCESGIYKDVHDVVRSVCREDIRLLHGYNDVGLADVPLIDVAELPWRR